MNAHHDAPILGTNRSGDGHGAVRALVVGAGLMGHWHARELGRAGGVLAGIVDPDGQRARNLARVRRIDATYDRLQDALADVAPEVVHLCTPLEAHEQLAHAAIRSGAHVLVEKPMTQDAVGTERLLEAASSRRLMACPVHQYLFQPGVQAASRMLRAVGPLLHIDFTACSAGGVGRDAATGHRIVAEILPHPISCLERLLSEAGPPARSAEELVWTSAQPKPGELRATGRGDGLTVSLLISLDGRPTRNELRLIGARGTVHLNLYHGYGTLERRSVSRSAKVVQPFALSAATVLATGANLVRRAARREPAYPGLRELICRFYAAARESGRPPIDNREALVVARVRDRLLAASAK